MSSFRLRRLASVVTLALLGVMLLGTGTASAAVASMEFQAGFTEKLPPTVSPNAMAGYSFRIHNKSTTTNISQLFLTAPDNGAATYVFNSRGTVCQWSPSLSCAFGALNAGAYIDVTVAYQVGTSNFSVTFKLDSTGGATKDGQHSHGDSVSLPLTTSVNSNQNFAGGFQFTDDQIATTGTLSRGNKQVSSVTPKDGATYIPVTIQDGLTGFPGLGDDPCLTFNCIGDWTQVRSGAGTNADGPIMVTLLLYGPSVPGQATLDNIGLWHEGSAPNPIMLRCSDPTSIPNGGTAECVTPSKVGNNIQILAWLLHNGGLRGTY